MLFEDTTQAGGEEYVSKLLKKNRNISQDPSNDIFDAYISEDGRYQSGGGGSSSDKPKTAMVRKTSMKDKKSKK